MENILDSNDEEPKTNYKKWSFRFFTYAILTNIIVFYKAAFFVSGFHSAEILYRDLTRLSYLSLLFLALGLFFIRLSFKNEEERNYQFYISIIGIPTLIILTGLVKFY